MTCRCGYEFCYVCGGKHQDCECTRKEEARRAAEQERRAAEREREQKKLAAQQTRAARMLAEMYARDERYFQAKA